MNYPIRVMTKLKKLPASPGVYLYKDKKGKIIYVGKAAILKNRVRQYFQPSRPLDSKTELLVADIASIDWLEVKSEIEALFLESELIKRYKPKYNVELRDDKHYEYVRVDIKSPHPIVRLVRRPMDDGAVYTGPFVYGIRPALKLLRRIFPYDTAVPGPNSSRLAVDLGLSPGLEYGRTSLKQYRLNLRRLIRYLNGGHATLEADLKKTMRAAAGSHRFEQAAHLRDQLSALKRLRSQMIFGDKELFDITKDQALDGLTKLINSYYSGSQLMQSDGVQGSGEEQSKSYVRYDARAPQPLTPQSAESADRVAGFAGQQARAVHQLRRVEGYDISHMSGTHNVASMVVFMDGVPDKQQYRKFKMRLAGNDDFAHMREVISRRFSGSNLREWPKPDLILIDGGKGQTGAAISVLVELGIDIPVIGLAKRFETLIIPSNPRFQEPSLEMVQLGLDSPIVQLLQRVRDESHRFAVSYHGTLKRQAQSRSVLDEIAGVGPKTRTLLLKRFGGKSGLLAATEADLKIVLGPKRGSVVFTELGRSRDSH